MKFAIFSSIIFLMKIVMQQDYSKCGCGTLKSENINYDPRSLIGYYKLLEQQLDFYTRYWANDMILQNVQAGKQLFKIVNIRIEKPSQQFINKIKDINQMDFINTKQDTIKSDNNNTIDIKEISKLDEFKNNNSYAKKTVEQMEQLLKQNYQDYQENLETALNQYAKCFGECRSKIGNNYQNKFNQCAANKIFPKIIQRMYGYEAHVTFKGEQYQFIKFYVVYNLDSVKKGAKFSFDYRPLFLLDINQLKTKEILDLIKQQRQTSKSIKKDFTFEQVWGKYNSLPNSEFNKLKDFSEYAKNYAIQIKNSGFYFSPGKVEHRTSCRLALGTLRLAIQMFFKIHYEPNTIMDYCPDYRQYIFPQNDVEIQFFYKAPPSIDKQPPKKNEKKSITDDKISLSDDPKPIAPPISLEEQQITEEEDINKTINPPLKTIPTAPPQKQISDEELFLDNELPSEVIYPIEFSCLDLEELEQKERFSQEALKYLKLFRSAFGVTVICKDKFKAQIEFFRNPIGYVEFFIEENGNMCTEIEVIFEGTEIAGYECHFGTYDDPSKLPHDVDANSYLANLMYLQSIKNIYNVVNQIYKKGQSSVDVIDFFKHFLYKFQLSDNKVLESESFSQIAYKNDNNYKGHKRNSIETNYGSIDIVYLKDYKYAPFQVSVSDSQKGYLKIKIDVGFQFLEIFIESEFQLNENDYNNFKSPKNTQNSENASDSFKKQMKQIKKKYLENSCKNKFQKFLYQIINADETNLFDNMAAYEGFKKINYPDFLLQYFKTDLMSFQVLAATFNYIMLQFDNDRLSLSDEKNINTIQNDLKNILNKKTEEAVISFWKRYENLEFEQDQTEQVQNNQPETDQLQENQELLSFNVYGLEEEFQWLYKFEFNQNTDQKSLQERINAHLDEKNIVASIDGNQLLNFDLEYLHQKFLYNQNNYSSALFGNKGFQAKTIVRLWRYNYHPMKVIHIRLETMKFHTDNIIAESNYYDVVRQFINIITQHHKHYASMMHSYRTTIGKDKIVSFNELFQITIEVLLQISENCQKNIQWKNSFGFLTQQQNEEQPDQQMQDIEIAQSMVQTNIQNEQNCKSSFNQQLCIAENSFTMENQQNSEILFKFYQINSDSILDQNITCSNDSKLKPAFKISQDGNYFKFQIFNARGIQDAPCEKNLKQKGEVQMRNFFNEYKFPTKSCYNTVEHFRRYIYNQIFYFQFGVYSSEL